VQATHLENKGKNIQDDPTKNPSKFPHNQFKGKFKKRDKMNTTTNKGEGNPSCTHCKKDGHGNEHCWKLHMEKKPKQFGEKGKTKTITKVQQDIGSCKCVEPTQNISS
jgi:hypothetical protein